MSENENWNSVNLVHVASLAEYHDVFKEGSDGGFMAALHGVGYEVSGPIKSIITYLEGYKQGRTSHLLNKVKESQLHINCNDVKCKLELTLSNDFNEYHAIMAFLNVVKDVRNGD